jgi:lysophospholipase L1-like esterase
MLDELQSSSVVEFFRKHRAFATVSASSGVALLLLVLGHAWFAKDGPARFGKSWWKFECFVAIACAVYVLGVATYLVLCEKKRRRFFPLVVIVWWIAVETFAPPYLSHTLELWHYGIMQDVDHRPREVGGEFNSDSLRGTSESSEFKPDGMNIVILGDSFTFGAGLDKADQAFPSVIGRMLREAHPELDVHVANFGWISSSPLISYRRLVDIGDKYKPKIVLMCVDMTDFDDDIKYQHMLDRDGLYAWYDRAPITLHYFRLWAPDTYARFLSWSVGGAPEKRFFITEAPLDETRKWFEPLVANVGKIREWCRARGADFVLVIMPRAYQYSDRESLHNWEANEYTTLGPYCREPFRYFDELRPKVDYPIVSMLDEFRSAKEFPLFRDDDPHWNAEGQRVAARGLVRVIEPIIARRLGH